MQVFFKFIKDHYQQFKIGFFFVIALVAVVSFFPSERKFKFEFQKGKPWSHNDYVAKFSFPIYKSDAELTAERDSLLRNFSPYYKLQSDVGEIQISALNQHYENLVDKQFVNNKSLLQQTDGFVKGLLNFADSAQMLLQGLFENVYDKGIVENNEMFEQLLRQNKSLAIIREGIAEETDPDNLFTHKAAYEFIKRNLDAFIDNYAGSYKRQMEALINEVNISEYIYSNLIYDEEATNRVREEIVAELSLTRGMIQKGELVISSGELVTAQKFIILESLRKEYETKIGDGSMYYLLYLGKIILVVSIFVVIYLFLFSFRPEILESTRLSVFILFMILLITFSASIILRKNVINFYFFPLAILPIIIRTFYDGRLALFIHISVILLIGYYVPNGFEFLFLNFMAGIVSIFSLTASNRRGKIIFTAILVTITYCFVYFGFAILQEGNINNIDYNNMLYFGLNGLLILISYPLIYVFEKTFGFLSDATLMELADTNQPLLRKLAERAPGTFQHSLQVANLAEEAIIRVGGNPLLARTGALYHDIGKMEEPIYFIENQTSGINPHDQLEFEQSAKKIIDHVNKGIEIAKKNNLPKPIIDFIRTHHGTTTVQYFYRSYIKKYPEKTTDINKFKYPGPRPFSKETAVLMMADSTEAASRSLKEITIVVVISQILTSSELL